MEADVTCDIWPGNNNFLSLIFNGDAKACTKLIVDKMISEANGNVSWNGASTLAAKQTESSEYLGYGDMVIERLINAGFFVAGKTLNGPITMPTAPTVGQMGPLYENCMVLTLEDEHAQNTPCGQFIEKWRRESGYEGDEYSSWHHYNKFVTIKEYDGNPVSEEFIAAMTSAGFYMEGVMPDGTKIPTEYRMARARNWFDSLKELVTNKDIPEAMHRILLYGPPGTGKSPFAGLVYKGRVERVSLHPAMPIEDLVGSVGLQSGGNGGTDTIWQDGPAVRAMREGIPLVLDEIDQYSPELRCCLHAILDDMKIAGITLPTGVRVEPNPGFCVFATTNAVPSALPAALLDRFDMTMLCDRPAAGVFKEITIKGMDKYLQRTYDRTATARWIPAVTVRTVLALERLAKRIGKEKAAELIYGSKGADILASAATGK